MSDEKTEKIQNAYDEACVMIQNAVIKYTDVIAEVDPEEGGHHIIGLLGGNVGSALFEFFHPDNYEVALEVLNQRAMDTINSLNGTSDKVEIVRTQ